MPPNDPTPDPVYLEPPVVEQDNLPGVIRAARRHARMNQRELAAAAGFSRSTIGKLESGSLKPSVGTLLRILSATDLVLVVTDADGKVVQPLKIWDGVRNGAGSNYPAHLDLVIDPKGDEWWGSTYGLARPPETFEHRPREYRDAKRKLSQWEVRVKQFRHDPRPPDPDRTAKGVSARARPRTLNATG